MPIVSRLAARSIWSPHPPERNDIHLHLKPAAERGTQQLAQVLRQISQQVQRGGHSTASPFGQSLGGIVGEQYTLQKWSGFPRHVKVGVKLATHALQADESLDQQRRSGGKARPWSLSMATRSDSIAARSSCFKGTPWY